MGNGTVMSLYILQEPDSKGFCQDYIYKNYKDFFLLILVSNQDWSYILQLIECEERNRKEEKNDLLIWGDVCKMQIDTLQDNCIYIRRLNLGNISLYVF